MSWVHRGLAFSVKFVGQQQIEYNPGSYRFFTPRGGDELLVCHLSMRELDESHFTAECVQETELEYEVN